MSHSVLVVCPPGLEQLVAQELTELGVHPGRAVTGGVPCHVSTQELYLLNLRLRCATRVLLRLGSAFVDGPRSLERLARSVDWTRFLSGGTVRVDAICMASTMSDPAAVRQVMADVMASPLEMSESADQRVIVRIDRDRAMLSIDSSGDRLDRRGYRLASVKAPLRETLAAGLVRFSGWHGNGPLVDPLCGSGTIAIEAAMAASGLAPGAGRSFAFEGWPSRSRRDLRRARELSAAQTRGGAAVVLAADRDAGAVTAARANASRAAVNVEVRQCAFSSLALPVGPGTIATNPPYGKRVSPGHDLRDLFDGFGAWLCRRAPGWTVAVVESDRARTTRLGLEIDEVLPTGSGGLSVRFVRGRVPA